MRIFVLIRERAEKPRSQSTVDIGRRRPIVASLLRFGNITLSSAVLNTLVMSSQGGNCFSSLLAADNTVEHLQFRFSILSAGLHCEGYSDQRAL